MRDAAERLVSSAGAAGPAESAWPTVAEIDAALAPLARVRFVAGEKSRPRRRPGRAIEQDGVYEIGIASRREVPTRPDNLHDLLNALAWAAFPAAKWALTARLAEAQRTRLADRPWRLPGARTRAHDRLALLDEGGVLIASRSPGLAIETALARGEARALVFGHALLEHALEGEVEVWGAAIALPVDPAGSTVELRERLDAALASALAGDRLLDAEPWPRIGLRALAVTSPG